jgi:serine acetyltransferase
MSLRAALSAVVRRVMTGLIHRMWTWVRAAGMVTADTAPGRRFARFGRGSSLSFPTGTVFGEQWIEIGSDTIVGAHVTLSAGMVPDLDLGPDPILRIGDRCAIGRGSHIVGHLSIEIGDDVFTGPYVYITDQNHGYEDPDVPIGRQWPRNNGVRIGSGSWLGAGAVILPGAQIGRNVVVAAGSVVRGEFPDHCVIAGMPARIVRRHVPGLGWEPPLRGVPVEAAAVEAQPDQAVS